MGVLDLTEVAELLGEPESTILAACERFPEHVPTTGLGRGRRFPSVALDVLRLITDAMTAGFPAETTTHLIEAHFPVGTTLDFPDEPEQESESSLPDLEPNGPVPSEPRDADAGADVASQPMAIHAAIGAALAPVMQTFDRALVALNGQIAELRENLAVTARADDLELLRVETRGIAIRRTETVAPGPGLPVALSAIDDAIADSRRVLTALRLEVAGLRTQLDHREQFAELAGDLAELRAEIQRLDWIGRRGNELARPTVVAVPSELAANRTSATSDLPPRSEPTPSAAPEDSRPSALGHRQNGSSPGPADESAPTIITQFAHRTPRRMGRSLFADEV